MTQRHRIRGNALPGLALAVIGVLWTGAAAGPQTVDSPARVEAARDFQLPDRQLARLIDGMLEESPRIAEVLELVQARHRRVPQERSLPDPQFVYRRFLSTPETRVGPQNLGVEISQGLPWFGKRELQAARADQLASEMAWHVQELERSLVAELKHIYFDAAYLQEALAINAEERALLQRFEKIALTRYSTGEGIQQNAIKVQTDVSRLADRGTSLTEQLLIAVRRIAELIGRPDAPLPLEPIRLALPKLRYDRDELERQALAQNPAVLATRQRIDADTTWVRRRHRDAYPDLSVGLGYVDVGRRDDPAAIANPPEDNGKDIWALSFKVNIPIHRSRIRAGVAEAEHNLSSTRQTLRRREDSLRREVREAILRLDALEERARLYREVLIPQAEESLASAESAYVTNRLDFLDLLDAERVLFQVRLTFHRLVADYWISLASLERAVARPFPGLAEAGILQPDEFPAERGMP